MPKKGQKLKKYSKETKLQAIQEEYMAGKEDKYIAVQYLNKTEHYPIEKLCGKLHLSRAGYYKWKNREPSQSQPINEQLVKWIKEYYEEQDGILGYRQMTITINREKKTQFHKKRIRRLMQILHLKSVCRGGIQRLFKNFLFFRLST